MYFIAAFGLLMMYLSSVMSARPHSFANSIVIFSQKPYFHLFEIASRMISGLVFVIFNQSTLFPVLSLAMGYLLITVSIGLLVIGEEKHKQFAVWSAAKFKHNFRAAGIASFAFGGFIIYMALARIFHSSM